MATFSKILFFGSIASLLGYLYCLKTEKKFKIILDDIENMPLIEFN